MATVILLAAVLFIGACVVIPATLMSFGVPVNIVDGIGDFFKNLFGGANSTGYSAVSFRIFYTDGTYDDVTPTNNGFSLVPMTVTYNGKQIQSVTINTNAVLVGDAITSWSSNTAQRIEFYKAGENIPRTSSSGNYPASGASWASGSSKQIATTTLTGATIDSVVAGYGTGASDWSMQVTNTVTMNAVVGGVSGTYTASAPAASMTFHYASGALQSFTVSIQIVPLAP